VTLSSETPLNQTKLPVNGGFHFNRVIHLKKKDLGLKAMFDIEVISV